MIELSVITLLIFINSLFVVSEISILTSAKAKLHKMSANGSKGAKKAIHLIHEPEVFLSTVQIGITLMGALLGLYGGASLAETLSNLISDIPYVDQYKNVIGYVLSLLIITYFTVLSEIIPKRVAMIYPEKIASFMSYFMYCCTIIMSPFIFILTESTKFCLHIFGIKQSDSNMSIDEVKFTINQAENSGVIERTERDMIKRLVNIGDMQVGAIMTPRNKIVYINLQDAIEININKFKSHPFAHFPVIERENGDIIGIVAVKKLLNTAVNNEIIKKIALNSPISYVPEISRVTRLIELFGSKQIKIALVVDEYGEIEGLVTLTDIMKTFLGDLVGIIDGRKPDIVTKKDGSYIMTGSTLIEEVMDILNLSSLPGDDEEEYRNLASFVLAQLGTLPKVGESCNACKWNFQVLKMDRFRIEKILVSKIQGTEE